MLLYDISRLTRMHDAPAAAALVHALRTAPAPVPHPAALPVKKG